ncbi:hypothetical protein RRG08_032974 [Elysia crispata]|uniref:Uncharacterized protein n=1 Tax=Elysia crispata TaxID=231223 RepID=A0AAE0YSM5_9GAST|nr:hypothetical protein RRG08_032974 [Elysia crispata]
MTIWGTRHVSWAGAGLLPVESVNSIHPYYCLEVFTSEDDDNIDVLLRIATASLLLFQHGPLPIRGLWRPHTLPSI